MSKQQPDALRLAEMLTADEWPGSVTLVSYARECVAELRTQHARITELESQLAQRFDAADMATAAAQGFRDGVVASVSAQAADSVPAVEREQERIAFKDAHRHLELYEGPDAWGRPMFKHSHVEASWLGWIARASHGQASSQAGEYPALVCDYCGALTPDPWHSSGMLHGKMSKHIHSCDACAARGAAKAQPAAQQGVAYAALPTSNCAGRVYEEGFLIGTCPLYTADQLRAFADATYALRAAHGQAPATEDSVLEDAARLDWLLLRISGAEFRRLGVHYSGNARRADVDAARKQGGAT